MEVNMMRNKSIELLFLLIPLLLMLISCSNNRKLNLKTDKGNFLKSKSGVMKSTYEKVNKLYSQLQIPYLFSSGPTI
jgi:hypothetical protein